MLRPPLADSPRLPGRFATEALDAYSFGVYRAEAMWND